MCDPKKKVRCAIPALFLYLCNLLQDNMTLLKIQWIISQTSQENEEALTSPYSRNGNIYNKQIIWFLVMQQILQNRAQDTFTEQ